MTRTIQQIGLHELTTMRVACPHCGIVLEMPVKMAGTQMGNSPRCQNCQKATPGGLPNAFRMFAVALDELQKMSGPESIEFVIPEKTSKQATA